MKRKYLALALTGVLSLALILGGCGNKEDSSKGSQKKGDSEITLMIPDWGAPTDEMLAKFKDETGITVHVQPTAWDDIKSKVAIASAGKNAPADVIEVDWSWTGEFVSAGWLEALDVPQDTVKDIPSISYFTVDKKYYGVPYANGIRLAYLNEEMMKKAGLSSTPKTWDEMESALETMKSKGVIEYPFLFPMNPEEKTTTSFLTLAFTKNGVIFNNDDTLNKESALNTLQQLKSYLDKGLIDPATVSTPGIDTFRGINNAQGAFLIGPTSFITSSNDPKVSKVVGQIDNIPIPGKNGPAAKTISFTEAVGVSSFSKHKEEAKKFIEWFSRPETQLELNKAINNTPTRTSVIEEMAEKGIIKRPGAIIEQSKIVTTPFPNGVPKYYTKMSTEIFNLINQMGQGKITPEDAANKMEAAVSKLVKENK